VKSLKNRNSNPVHYIPHVLCLLILIFSLYDSTDKRTSFISFSSLTMKEESACTVSTSSSLDAVSQVIKVGESPCESVSVVPPAPVIRMHYYIPEGAQGGHFLKVYQNEIVTQEIDLSDGRKELPSWQTIYIENKSENPQKGLHFEFTGDKLEVRKRIEYLSAVPEPLWLSVVGNFKPELHKTIPKSLIISVLVAFLLYASSMSFVTYVLILFTTNVLMFYSVQPFYYYDEWFVMQWLKNTGLQGIWLPHNEHFLPLFFAWYYVLVSLGGADYHILHFFSLILHVIHAVLFFCFLKYFQLPDRAIRISVFLYSIAAVHLEVVEWVFEQCIILSSIAGLLSMIYLIKYVRSGHISYLFIFLMGLLMAPVLFGNGFVYLPLSLVMVLLHVLLYYRSISKQHFLRVSCAFLGSVVVFVPLVLIYSLKSSISAAEAKPDIFMLLLGNITKIIGYILIGSGIGSVLRGLGLYPSLGLSSVMDMVNAFSPVLAEMLSGVLPGWPSIEILIAVFVHMVIFSAFLAAFCMHRARYLLLYYSGGVSFLFFALLLPGLARFSLGELQSLALRYQYQGLFGVVLILLGLGRYCLDLATVKRLKNYLKPVILTFISAWIFIQVNLHNSFNYFRHYGELHRVYLGSIADWKDNLGDMQNTSYEGEEEMRGLFPLNYSTITPAAHPLDILATYTWISDK
jgi:hypothetical protein